MNYINTIQRKQLWICRVFTWLFRWRDPEQEARENYKNRIYDRYKNK